MPIHIHENCLKMARQPDGTPWWSVFPLPESTPENISVSEVYHLLSELSELSNHSEHSELSELSEHDKSTGEKPREFLLVDVRRTDCVGGTVTSALNLPAHSFFHTRKSLYQLCRQAGVKRVIFYCGKSKCFTCTLPDPGLGLLSSVSDYQVRDQTRLMCRLGQSNGRGPRCAAWFKDYIDEVGGDIQSQVMTGGIRGWVAAYGGQMMDGFDEKAWEAEKE